MQTVIDGVLTNYHLLNPHQKNTLLILHGWRQSGSFWTSTLSDLPTDTTYIALDLPAFGATAPLSGHPGVPEYADFIKSFIIKLDLKNVFLLGHSFGGQVATDFALRFPKHIKHLILVSPASIRNLTPTKKAKIASLIKPLISILPHSISKMFFDKIASPNYQHSNQIQRDIFKKILHQDYSHKIKDITVPTSIIWGSEDYTIPNKGKFLAENIRNSHLYVLYGADHSPHLSAPKKLLPVLTQILTKHAK